MISKNDFNGFINTFENYNIEVDFRGLGNCVYVREVADYKNLYNIKYILNNILKIDKVLNLDMVDTSNLYVLNGIANKLNAISQEINSPELLVKKDAYTLSSTPIIVNLTIMEALFFCNILDKIVQLIGDLYRNWTSETPGDMHRFHPDVLSTLSARIKQAVGEVAAEVLYDCWL